MPVIVCAAQTSTYFRDCRLVQVFGILVVWPLMVAGTAAATYLIVTNNDLIIQRSGFGFAPLLMLSLVSIVSGILCTMSVLTEDWHPRMRTNVGPAVPDELWPPFHMQCTC